MESDTAKVEKNSGKYKKGQARPNNSGRKKGTPNKKTAELKDILNNHHFEPATKMIELFIATEDDNIKLGILKELMKYIYPQRKAVDCIIQPENSSMAEFMQGLAKVRK